MTDISTTNGYVATAHLSSGTHTPDLVITITYHGGDVIAINTGTIEGINELAMILGAPLHVLRTAVAANFEKQNKDVDKHDPDWGLGLSALPASSSVSWVIDPVYIKELEKGKSRGMYRITFWVKPRFLPGLAGK